MPAAPGRGASGTPTRARSVQVNPRFCELLLGCLLAFHALGLSAAAVLPQGVSTEVSTNAELASALLNPNATTIVLKSNVTIHRQEWTQYSKLDPLVVSRNVTLTSDPKYLTLDFEFVGSKVQLASGVALTFKDIILRHSRYGAGINFLDFFAYSPGALIKHINVISLREACAPNIDAVNGLPMAPRLKGYPGQQKLHLVPDHRYCVNDACLPEAVVYDDVTMNPTLTEDQAAGGYGLMLINSSKACRTLVPSNCLEQNTPDACVTEAIDSMVIVDTPGRRAARAARDQQERLVAVTVGPLVACVGALLLCGVVLLVVMLRRTSRALPPGAADQACALPGSTPDEDMGPMIKICPGEQPTSSSWEISLQRTAQNLPDTGSSSSPTTSLGRSDSLFSNAVHLGVLLGAGSFGRVYKARWRNLDVAVKVMRHSSKTADMVLNEVNLMLSFSHPNIVRALHVINWVHRRVNHDSPVLRDQAVLGLPPPHTGEPDRDGSTFGATCAPPRVQEDAQTWIVQEYCDKGSMADAFLDRGPPTSDLDMLRLLYRLVEVAQALRYLHSRNVIHGDLKTANVLLCSAADAPFGCRAKVTDFGISRALHAGQTHRSTRTLGTVSHMAPELLRLGRLSAAADIFAFGIMMWELMSGRMAFTDMHYGEVVERVSLNSERPAIPEQTPEDYALLMQRCWVEGPSQRPSIEQVERCLGIMLTSLQQQLVVSGQLAECGCSWVVDSNNGPQDLV